MSILIFYYLNKTANYKYSDQSQGTLDQADILGNIETDLLILESTDI